MNFQDYQNQAKRTLKCTMTPDELISNLGLGITGECGELAFLVNSLHSNFKSNIKDINSEIKDECSDLAWYIFMIGEFYGFELHTFARLAEDTYYKKLIQTEYEHPCYAILELVYQCGHLADYIKKVVYHKHDFDFVKMKFMLLYTLGAWIGFIDYYDLDVSEILQHNIDKLWKRYPNGFNHEDSRKRQDVHTDQSI